MTTRRLLSAFLFTLCCTCTASSQVASAQTNPSSDAGQRAAARRSEINVDSTLPAVLQGVAIEAGQADGQATINYTQKLGNQSVVAKLSTPVAKDAKDTDFASLNGLASDLSFSLAYTGFCVPTPAVGSEKVYADQKKICKKYGAAENECDSQGLTRAVAATCGFTEITKVKLLSAVPDELKKLLAAASSAQRNCFESLRDRALDDFDFASFQGKMIGSWAVTGEVARKPATFFQSDGNTQKKTNVPYSVSAAYGWIDKNARYSLSGRYESRFKDGKNVTLCQPFAGGVASSNLETCEQLPFGSPMRSSAFVASAEGRWFFRKLAVSPVISYDFKEKVLGLQLPIYFVRDSNNDFTGGVRFGWRDDTHNLTTSVFVSKALSLVD